jgi:autotransporter-associated beta strand protein
MNTCFNGLGLLIAAALLILGAQQQSLAGSATWNLNPSNGDWNTAANWTPETVPNSETDVATFGQSNVTDINISQTFVGGMTFIAEADPYSFTIANQDAVAYLDLWGDGITNNSTSGQTFRLPFNALRAVSVAFRNTSTAGDRVTYLVDGGDLFFFDSSSAGSATFDVSAPGTLYFSSTASAANATITNYDYGYSYFSSSATAGNAYITNQPNGHTEIDAYSGNAMIVNEGVTSTDKSAGYTSISSMGYGDTATIINYPASVRGGEGGHTGFYSFVGYVGSPTVINYGSSFGGNSSGKTFLYAQAGNATLIASGGVNGGIGGAIICISEYAEGDTAAINLEGNGFLDLGIPTLKSLSIGSLEGDGEVFLGGNGLGIGTNNLSTEFAGVIQDGGRHHLTGGSVVKLGSGTLTLTGANTYTGGTIIKDGALLVKNKEGSGTGSGAVRVNQGTLGGIGIIAGLTAIGTGSGTGAFLTPALGSDAQATLTIQSAMTLNADATYTYTFAANRNQSRTDLVIANGVTINGATLNLVGTTQGSLKQGLTLTLISNTSANPISGTFSNLPDGGIVTVNGNNLQASYHGGDGNNLTLTVIP